MTPMAATNVTRMPGERRAPRVVRRRGLSHRLVPLVSLVLLLSLTGVHWGILQTVAWGRMIVAYSAEDGFALGVKKTFDGQHPCPLCKAIKRARASEQNAPAALSPVREVVDWVFVMPETVGLSVSGFRPDYAAFHPRGGLVHRRPPTPPPRTPPGA